MLIKTTTERYAAVEAEIRARHPHELPEIVALPNRQGAARLPAVALPTRPDRTETPEMPHWILPFLLCLFACAGSARAEEFLDPLVAFKPTAKVIDGQTAEVRFTIAKGYYLYRDKFRFKAEPETVAL